MANPEGINSFTSFSTQASTSAFYPSNNIFGPPLTADITTSTPLVAFKR